VTKILTGAGFALAASLTLPMATIAVAQQEAPSPVVQTVPAVTSEPPSPTTVIAAPVLPAEQVAPAELTGLLGHTVVANSGPDLGRIVDLLVDGQGRVRAIVLDVGGFMGVGNRKVAVAWSALRFSTGEKEPTITIIIPSDRIKSWAEYISGRPVAILGASGGSP
jgi:hypothetical protein